MSYPLHKRPKALARYYVTSYWKAEWVKKLRWKTIESPPRPLNGTYRSSHWIELHHGAFLPNFCLALVRRSSISAVLTVPKYATASCRSLGIIGRIPVLRRESSLWAGECSYPWWGYIGSPVELVECPCSFDTPSSLFLMRLLPCHFFVAIWGRGNVLKPILRDKLLLLSADELGSIVCDHAIRYPEPCKVCFHELHNFCRESIW